MGKRKIKYRYIVLLGSLLLAVLLFFPLRQAFFSYADDLLYRTLSKMVETETNGKYQIQYDDLRFNIFSQRFKINNFRYMPKDSLALDEGILKKENSIQFGVIIEELEIHLDNELDFFFNNRLSIEFVEVKHPDVEVVNNKFSKTKVELGELAGNLYKLVTQYLRVFELKNVKVQDAELLYHLRTTEFKKSFKFDSFSFQVNDFKLDRDEDISHSKKLLFTDDFQLNSGHQEFILPDSIHRISFDRFNISLKQEQISFHNLRIRFDEQQTGDHVNTTELFIPRLAFDQIDFDKAFYENKIVLQSLEIKRPAVSLTVYEDMLKKPSKIDSTSSIDSTLLSVIKQLLVERLLLEEADVSIDYFDQDMVKHEFLVSNLNFRSQHVEMDSTLLLNFKLKDLSRNYHLAAEEIKYHVPDNGLLLKTGELKYSSITHDLSLDNLSVLPSEKRIQRNIWLKKKRVQFKSLDVDEIKIMDLDLNALVDAGDASFRAGKLKKPNLILYYDTAFVKDTTTTKKSAATLFGNFIDSLSARDFNIEKALIQIVDARNTKQEFARFEDVDLYVPESDMQQFTNQVDWLALLDKVAINTGRSHLDIPDYGQKMKWRALNYSTALKELKLAKVDGHFQTKKVQLDFQAQDVQFADFTFSELIKEKKYNLGYASLSTGSVNIKRRTDKEESRNKKFIAFQLDSLRLHDIDLKDYKNGALQQRMDSMNLVLSHLNRVQDSNGTEKVHVQELNFSAINGFKLVDKGRHTLSFSSIDFSTQDSTIDLMTLEIKPVLKQKLNANNSIYRSTIPSIAISGMSIGEDHVLDQIHADRIDICSPEFRMSRSGNQRKSISQGSLLELHEWFSTVTGIGSIAYRELNLENGLVDMTYESASDPTKKWVTFIPQYELTSRNFNLDVNQRNTDDNLFYADLYELKAYQIQQSFPDFYRNVDIDYMEFNSSEHYLKLEGSDFQYMVYDEGSGAKKLFIDGKIPLMEIEGIRPLEIKERKRMNLKRVHFNEPSIEITQFHKASEIVSRELKTDNSGFDQAAIEDIVFQELELSDGHITWDFEDSTKNAFQFKHVNLNGDKIEISQDDVLPDFAEVELSFGNFRHDVLDKFYDLEMDSFYLNSAEKLLLIKGSSLIPRYRIFEFAQVAGWEKGRLEMYVPQAQVSGLDIKSMIYNQSIDADLVEVDSLWVRSFKNKKMPMIERSMPLPMAMLSNSPFKIAVDSVRLNSGFIEHRQLAANGIKNGTLTLTDLQATMNNITNDTAILAKNNKSQLSASARLFGEALINSDFEFYLEDPENRFTVDASVSGFDAKLLNEYLEHTAFVRIRKGKVNGAELNFIAYDQYGVGDMRLLYKNLHVDFLNHDTGKAKDKGLIMKSFLANRVVNTQNPHLFITKKGDIFYRRDTSRAVFQYWTMLAMSGVASSTGINNNRKERKRLEKEIKRIRKEEMRREKAIRRREEELEEGEATTTP